MAERDYPIYGIYVSGRRIPRKKQNTLAEAVIEAGRLAKLTNLDAFVIEYNEAPVVLCRCTVDSKIEPM